MPFEQVTVVYRDGRQLGGIPWMGVEQMIRERRLPSNAALIDERTGERRGVESFPQLMALVSTGDGTSVLIPYKNGPALAAYYLGIFSFFACVPLLGVVGLGLAIPALVLGVKGLRRVKEHPEVHGTAHAWIGIVCGVLFTIAGIGQIVLLVVVLVASMEQR